MNEPRNYEQATQLADRASDNATRHKTPFVVAQRARQTTVLLEVMTLDDFNSCWRRSRYNPHTIQLNHIAFPLRKRHTCQACGRNL